MYVDGTNISCGIYQLSDVGNRPDQENYEYQMSQAECCIVLASLTTKQTNGIAFLEKNGFERVGKPKVNPNSKNKILLFMKTLTEKERSHFRALASKQDRENAY